MKIALFDTEFIVVGIKSKTSKKQRLLAEKKAVFPRVLKIQPFWAKCKGPIFADFHSWISEASKNRKYLSDFRENSLI